MTRAELDNALPALAAGALDAATRTAVLAGLAKHADLMAKARSFGVVLPAVLGGLPEVAPKPALRAKVIAAALEARPARKMVEPLKRSWMDELQAWLQGAFALPRYASLAMAALALVALGGLGLAWQREGAANAQLAAERTRLVAEQERLSGERVQLQQQSAAQQALIAALSAPDAQAVNLNSTSAAAGVTARVAYAPGSRSAIFQARGLPALPDAQRYQLWLFDATGTPQPSILFADANAPVLLDAQQALGAYINFAVSIEPRTGSRAPTGPVVLIAKG